MAFLQKVAQFSAMFQTEQVSSLLKVYDILQVDETDRQRERVQVPVCRHGSVVLQVNDDNTRFSVDRSSAEVEVNGSL